MRKIDLTGQRFTRLSVVKEIGRSNSGRVVWRCVCDCGEVRDVPSGDLRTGNTKSCGCYNREVLLKKSTTHGKSRTPEYTVWKAMKRRCFNGNSKGYSKYGARGITVCEQWSSFGIFFRDMGEKPGEEYSIERIDNDGPYSPENCRWATMTEQCRNQRVRANSIAGVTGVTWYKPLSKWLVTIGVNYKRIHIGYFKNLANAKGARREAERRYWDVC